MHIFLTLAFVLLASVAHSAEITADWSYAKKQLVKAGFKRDFIDALANSYEPTEFKNVLELNILLYLRKSDYHGVQVTDEAVGKVGDFITANQNVLGKATRDYGVPGSTVASLLWIESRYGSNLGTFHVPSVYVHLLQADRPQVLRHLKTDGPKRFSANPQKKDLAKIPARVRTKAKWALGELKALQKMFHQRGRFAVGLRGSFSGAFGMPQFLPSSYLRWARTTRAGAPPDLTRPDDAILSVAHYLRENGWRKSRPKTHMRALLNYNNSRDYANAILTLAKQADGRGLASASANTTTTTTTTTTK
jgi:membrane-bound lytic murein transglycosylase B